MLTDIQQLELLRDKINSEYAALKTPKYDEIHVIDNELTAKLNDIDDQIDTLKTQEKTKADIKKKIALGLFTHDDYLALSDDDKSLAKDALFDIYSQDKINSFRAASALEFGFIALAKMFIKAADRTKLSPDEQVFLSQYEAVIGQHPMAINAVGWEVPYIQQQMQLILGNRSEYTTKKIDITGSFTA